MSSPVIILLSKKVSLPSRLWQDNIHPIYETKDKHGKLLCLVRELLDSF
jgi:hypothetical protein